MRQLLLTSALLLLCLCTRGEIRWLTTDYDFGTWHEVQGKRSGRVQFINTGTDTVAIISVRPSCGCTGTDYTRAPIPPGDTAYVSFTYDPTRRPGRFEKTIKVYTTPGKQLQVITIRGTVVGAPESLVSDFPISAGPLRLSADTYDFGTSEQGKPRHAYLNAYNQGNDSISPIVTFPADGPLEAKIARRHVAPGESFTIGLYLSTRTLTPGAHSWPIRISADTATINALVSIDLRPATSRLDSASIARAPRIHTPSAPVELTPRKPGEKVKFKFPIENQGLSTLNACRVYSRAEAAHVTRFPRTLKPGGKGFVEGYIDLAQVQGPAFGFIIEIITDDPLLPVATVRVTGQTPRDN